MTLRIVHLVFLIAAGGPVSFGQVPTGTPPGDSTRARHAFTITASTPEPEFGLGFRIQVTRSCPSGEEPDPLPAALLEPLHVRLLESRAKLSKGRWTSTEIFEARAFTRGRIVIEDREWASRDPQSGVLTSTRAPRLELAVRSSLAGHGEEVEGPRGLFPLPETRRPPWLWAALLASLATTTLLAWRMVSRARSRRTSTGLPPRERLLQALDRRVEATGSDPRELSQELLSAARHHLRESGDGLAPDASFQELLQLGLGPERAREQQLFESLLPRIEQEAFGRAGDATLDEKTRAELRELHELLAGAQTTEATTR